MEGPLAATPEAMVSLAGGRSIGQRRYGIGVTPDSINLTGPRADAAINWNCAGRISTGKRFLRQALAQALSLQHDPPRIHSGDRQGDKPARPMTGRVRGIKDTGRAICSSAGHGGRLADSLRRRQQEGMPPLRLFTRHRMHAEACKNNARPGLFYRAAIAQRAGGVARKAALSVFSPGVPRQKVLSPSRPSDG